MTTANDIEIRGFQEVDIDWTKHKFSYWIKYGEQVAIQFHGSIYRGMTKTVILCY